MPSGSLFTSRDNNKVNIVFQNNKLKLGLAGRHPVSDFVYIVWQNKVTVRLQINNK